MAIASKLHYLEDFFWCVWKGKDLNFYMKNFIVLQEKEVKCKHKHKHRDRMLARARIERDRVTGKLHST